MIVFPSFFLLQIAWKEKLFPWIDSGFEKSIYHRPHDYLRALASTCNTHTIVYLFTMKRQQCSTNVINIPIEWRFNSIQRGSINIYVCYTHYINIIDNNYNEWCSKKNINSIQKNRCTAVKTKTAIWTEVKIIYVAYLFILEHVT